MAIALAFPKSALVRSDLQRVFTHCRSLIRQERSFVIKEELTDFFFFRCYICGNVGHLQAQVSFAAAQSAAAALSQHAPFSVLTLAALVPPSRLRLRI